MSKFYPVRYVGEDRADIRNGEIYQATESRALPQMLGVIDRSGEAFLYPRKYFERVEQPVDKTEEAEKTST